MNETIGGRTVIDWSTPNRNTGNWTQCDATHKETRLLDTTQYPDGPVSMSLAAGDAASPANVTTYQGHLQIDNQPVTLDLTGPSDAPSTAGTQYVTATATAGPSGDSIVCAVDGGSPQSYPGATAAVPVSGIGQHSVSCHAQNNALDQYGNPYVTSTRTLSMTIRQPTAAAVWLPKLLNAPKCTTDKVRVRTTTWSVPVNGSRPKRRSRPRTRTVTRTVRHCHVRIVRRKVVTWKVEKRHGRRVRVRHVRWVSVALSPQSVNATTVSTPYGASTLVTGWLGTTNSTPLAGRTVTILAAADNGNNAFIPATTAITGADGSWAVHLPAGPSRLVEATYPGSTTEEPTTSAPVTIKVPTVVYLHLNRRRARWGRTITITGQLMGGWVPPSGELVVLRIGWHGGSTEIGHLYTDGLGRFSTRYRFLRGTGTEHYAIWAQSVQESDYPYTPSASAHLPITVSSG
jgi:hypothetical protein